MKRPKLMPLGSLEERVMDVMWDGDARTVREVAARIGRRLAYTTVMTTLDRLHKKGLLARVREGNAFRYRAAVTRDEFHRRLVEDTVAGLLAQSADSALAGFLDAAEAVDEENLARLERLIARRRGRR